MHDELVEASMETIRMSVLWASSVAKYVGIQPTDLFAIALLLETTTATAGKLMETTGLSSGATTAMIDRLAATGIVVRESDPDDARRVIVRLVAPPQSVEFIRTVTAQEISNAVKRPKAISVQGWISAHIATATAIRSAIEKFDSAIKKPSKHVVSERDRSNGRK